MNAFTTTLLGYGSLLHPDQVAKYGVAAERCRPVRLRGFRRGFWQEPARRRGVGDARAVLTVQPADPAHASGGWINALLIPGLDADAMADLDERERGYDRLAVDPPQMTPYDGAAPPAHEPVVIYVGRADRFNPALGPHAEYEQLCLDGARHWGEAFVRDYLATTFVGQRTLAEIQPR